MDTKTHQYDPFGGYLAPPTEDEIEMARLLDLIGSEWRSDPKSVACFDRRIVSDVQAALDRHAKRVKAQGPGKWRP